MSGVECLLNITPWALPLRQRSLGWLSCYIFCSREIVEQTPFYSLFGRCRPSLACVHMRHSSHPLAHYTLCGLLCSETCSSRIRSIGESQTVRPSRASLVSAIAAQSTCPRLRDIAACATMLAVTATSSSPSTTARRACALCSSTSRATWSRSPGAHRPPYLAEQPGWAEQDPEIYWSALCQACQRLWQRPSPGGECEARLAGVASPRSAPPSSTSTEPGTRSARRSSGSISAAPTASSRSAGCGGWHSRWSA